MTIVSIRPIREDLPFGARVEGVTAAALEDDDVRRELNEAFERNGMLVFGGVEPSTELQARISLVFGPLKDHPTKSTTRVDQDRYPGLIEIASTEGMCIVEIEGQPLVNWQPWHFDHCYNDELNRAGVLRAAQIPASGTRTGFADGIQVYRDLDPDIRARIEGHSVIYTHDLLYSNQRFGLPPTFRELKPYTHAAAVLARAAGSPRAIHPAVWARPTGEKVFHLSPYQAVGLEGHEDAEGEALFHEVWAEVMRVITPYYHQWAPTDMVVWDNWRMLHEGGGCPPGQDRVMHRTTIKGDYGLGRFEAAPPSPAGAAAP